MATRIRLMGKFLPIYENEDSVLPDKIRICTEEGKVVDYIPAVPKKYKSVFSELLDHFNETCYGGRKPKTKQRRRKNNG